MSRQQKGWFAKLFTRMYSKADYQIRLVGLVLVSVVAAAAFFNESAVVIAMDTRGVYIRAQVLGVEPAIIQYRLGDKTEYDTHARFEGYEGVHLLKNRYEPGTTFRIRYLPEDLSTFFITDLDEPGGIVSSFTDRLSNEGRELLWVPAFLIFLGGFGFPHTWRKLKEPLEASEN